MALYPILLNLNNRTAVVVGGGLVALRKVRDLLDTGARITVIAPEVHPELKALTLKQDRIVLEQRPYRAGDLDGAVLVFSCTDSHVVNRQVFEDAETLGIFINAADDPPNCSFFLPSFARRGDFILAVSTSGTSPALAARLRRTLEQAVPENIDGLLDALKTARRLLLDSADFSHLDSSQRGQILKTIVNSDEFLQELYYAYLHGTLAHCLLKHIRNTR